MPATPTRTLHLSIVELVALDIALRDHIEQLESVKDVNRENIATLQGIRDQITTVLFPKTGN